MNTNRTTMKTTLTRPHMLPWAVADAGWTQRTLVGNIEHLAAGFAPISLEQMEDVALLNRIDTKFVMPAEKLPEVLAQLQTNYWMLSVHGQRLNHYRTLYFDTPGFDLYHAHVNDRPERYKVRCREYADTSLSFLEVKHHTRKDRTVKDRIRTARPLVQVTADMEQWLRSVSPLDGSALEPKLWNSFTRLTLVSKQLCERVTLDIDLAFSVGDRQVRLDGIAIAEVKMGFAMCASLFLNQMRAHRIQQRGFSKYAVGVAMLYDQVKKNALKPKMLMIEKMTKGLVSYE